MIYLANVSGLETVSIPKATYMYWISIENFSGTTFDFSMLMNAGTINISSGPNASHFDVSFPALTNVSRINISGNLGRSVKQIYIPPLSPLNMILVCLYLSSR
jgi:hypothetical protein